MRIFPGRTTDAIIAITAISMGAATGLTIKFATIAPQATPWGAAMERMVSDLNGISGGELDVLSGNTKIVDGGYTLATSGSGQVKLVSDTFYLSNGTLTNAGTINLAGDFGILGDGGTNLFNNSGTVVKSAGSVTSSIGVPIADTNGLWSAASGTLSLAAGGSGSGTLTIGAGAGTVAFGNGSYALNNLSTVSGATLGMTGRSHGAHRPGNCSPTKKARIARR